MQLRDYQVKAVNRVMQTRDNVIVALPTGTGKSVVIAAIAQEYARGGKRVLVLAHVKELAEQNARAFARLCNGEISHGIYCAGLGKRETGARVTFGTIASVSRVASLFVGVNVLLIDECQLVSDKQNSMYFRTIQTLKENTDWLRVVGFSATPYRTKDGALERGKIFDHVAVPGTTKKAFDFFTKRGYIVPLVPIEPRAKYSTQGVTMRGGDFAKGELLRAVAAQQDVTTQCVARMVERAAHRKHWLVFGAGINHCEQIAAALATHGVTCAVVSSKIDDKTRDARIAAFKAGQLRALVNTNVLTTGFDFPGIDALCVLRPTASPVLWMQILGRGMRPAQGKENCLVLDFGGNIERLGLPCQIEPPKPREKGGNGVAPTKVCPECETIVHAAVRTCACCGHGFPPPEIKLESEPYTEQPRTVAVFSTSITKHTKPGKPTSLRVTYHTHELGPVDEWVCFEHTGFPRQKAVWWWRDLTGERYAPRTVQEAIARGAKVRAIRQITVRKEGKWWRVLKRQTQRGEA